MVSDNLITIITVCYNSEKTIKRTLDSLLNQTNSDFEYIVVDGDSTDNTINIIEEYMPRFNGQMKYISEKDDGIYDAMNKGISLSTGDYIALLNSDDWYEKHTIEVVKDAIKNDNDIDIYYGYIRLIKNGKEYMVRRNNYEFIMEGTGMIQHPTCFIKKEAYDQIGTYDTSYKVCADQDLMIRMITSGKTYRGIDNILTNFSIGGISTVYDTFYEVLRFKSTYGIMSKSAVRKAIILHKIKSFYKYTKKVFAWK